jgi:hypothetical protein
MFRRVFLVLSICLLLSSLAAVAADKPDFSGQWKLNLEKSDFGPMPKPDKADYTVTHKDPDMTIKTVMSSSQMGEMTVEIKIFTDGREFTNEMNGQQIKGTAKWEGKSLVVTSKFQVQDAEIKFIQKWTLSDDGKSLTQEISISSPQGDLQQKAVLDKV